MMVEIPTSVDRFINLYYDDPWHRALGVLRCGPYPSQTHGHSSECGRCCRDRHFRGSSLCNRCKDRNGSVYLSATVRTFLFLCFLFFYGYSSSRGREVFCVRRSSKEKRRQGNNSHEPPLTSPSVLIKSYIVFFFSKIFIKKELGLFAAF